MRASPRPTPEVRREWSEVHVAAEADEGTFVGRTTWRSVAGDRRSNQSVRISQHWHRLGGQWRLASQQVVMLPPPPEIVAFASGALTLKAAVFRPQGPGPFPAVVYGHGNEPEPGELFEVIGPALAQRGYLVFAPHRRGAGLSRDQGENLLGRLTEIERTQGVAARSRAAIEQLEGPQLGDVAAAIEAVRQRADVDRRRVFFIGNSFGGVLAMLAAERGMGLAGVANFAGAALNWERSELFRERMVLAARRSRVPVYVAQAHNDFSVEPTRALGRELCAGHKVHRAKVYPPFGLTHGEGHAFGIDGVAVWGSDVLAFFEMPDTPEACR